MTSSELKVYFDMDEGGSELVPATLTSSYKVLISNEMTGLYNIIHPKYSQFVIEVSDPVFTLGEFAALRIVMKHNQIHTCEATFYGLSDAKRNLIVYNAPLRIRVNGRAVFLGLIKRVENDRTKKRTTIWGESNAAILRDTVVLHPTEWPTTNSAQIISDLLNNEGLYLRDGMDKWSFIPPDDTGHIIDYRATGGSLLTHISNICKMNAWEWSTYINSESHTVTAIGTTTINVDDTWDTNALVGYVGVVVSGTNREYGFTITANSGSTWTCADADFTGVQIGDHVILWTDHTLEISSHIGSELVEEQYTENSNCAYLEKRDNIDKLFTTVSVSGSEAEMADQYSFYGGWTTDVATLLTTESFLVKNATPGTTYHELYDALSYPQTGGTIQIGAESFEYEYRSGNQLRLSSSVAARAGADYHYVGEDVLLISELECTQPISWTSNNNYCWIGTEKIGFDSISGSKFINLTRGVDTASYSHVATIRVRNDYYDVNTPQTGSAVDLHGAREYRDSSIGALTRNSLDFRAQSVFDKVSAPATQGTFMLLDTDFWKDIGLGDAITITDRDGNMWYSRVMGVTYEWPKPVVVEYGYPEDWLMDKFQEADKAGFVANIKHKNTGVATAWEVSPDGKYAKIKIDDDFYWVEMT